MTTEDHSPRGQFLDELEADTDVSKDDDVNALHSRVSRSLAPTRRAHWRAVAIPLVISITVGLASSMPFSHVSAAPPAQDLRGELHAFVSRLSTQCATELSPVERTTATKLLIACGNSDDPRLMSDLRVVASSCWNTPSTQWFSLEALDALWRLGEHESHFLALVEQFESKPRLAQYAMTVLARAPTESSVARFEQILRQAEAFELPEASMFSLPSVMAGHVLRCKAQLEERTDPGAKVAWLCESAIGGYYLASGLISCIPTDPTTFPEFAQHRTDPLVAWSRAELARISAEHPAAAARAVHASVAGDRSFPPKDSEQQAEWRVKYRFWLSRFLAPQSQDVYRALVAQGQ